MKLPIKTFVVEDTPRELRVLEERLDNNFRPLAIAESYNSAVRILSENSGSPFGLSILDILISNKECYGLIDTFGREKMGWIAFTTIRSRPILPEYIPQDHPNFFLIKPHNKRNVDELINKIEGHINEINSKNGIPFDYNFLTLNNEDLPLKREDILYIQGGRRDGGNKDYSWIFYIEDDTPKKEMIKHRLKDIEVLLSKTDFWRCHNKCIVNIIHLKMLLRNSSLSTDLALEIKVRLYVKNLLRPISPKRN